MYRSGNPPDLAELPTAQIGLWAQSGYLKPLNSFLKSASWWQHFPKVVQSEGTFNGNVYAVNHGENTSLLYYNKDLLATAGVKLPWEPKNWAQILNAAKAVKAHDKNVIPLWLAAGTGSGTNGILQGGGNLINGCPTPTIYQESSAKWVVDSPCLRSVLSFYSKVYKDGLGAPVSTLFSPSAVTAPLTLFKQGKLAIAVGSNYYGGAWQPSVCGPCWAGATKVMRTAPIPTQNGQTPGIASTIGGWDIAMSAKTKDPSLAWKALNLLESEQFIVDAANWAGFVPPNTAFATAPGYANFAPPYQVAAAKVLPYATLTPSQAAYTEWGHAFEVATGEIASHPQSTTVDKAISALKSDTETTLGPSLVTTIK
jgi:multiple sugar transport system substrate-binding protein